MTKALLHSSPDFRKLLTVAFFSTFGDWLSMMALSYLVFERSGVSTLGLLTSVPVILGVLLSPWIGALVDRHSARQVVIVATLAMAAVTAALQWYDAFFYIVLLTLKQVLGTVMYAGQGRLVPAVVPDHELERGAGLLNGADRLAAGLGLVAGPLLAAWLGPTVFLVDAATFVLAALLFRSMRTDTAPRPADGPEAKVRVRAVFPWLRAQAGVLALYCVGSALWGLRDIGTLPVVQSRLELDIAHWAGIFAALALVGEIAGSAVLAWRNPDIRERNMLLVAGLVVALGCLIAVPAVSTWFPAVVGGKVLEGFVSNLLGAVTTIVLIFRAPEELRGRVAGVVFSLSMGVLAGAKAGFGYLIAHLGVVTVYRGLLQLMLAGTAVAVAVALVRASRRRPTLHQGPP